MTEVRLTTAPVSVIIPTFQRPALVPRAVHSALAQTLRAIEVIVVMDGPDPATECALAEIKDPRLQIVRLPVRRGLANARNAGTAFARTRWVALLDDDDEWFPEKLEQQLAVAERSRFRFPLVSCLLYARHDVGDLIWPRRFPNPGEPLSEYLFSQHSWRGGEGLILPSTFLTLTELVRQVPFKTSARWHEDVDWLLRANTIPGFGVEFVPALQPLAIWHMESDHPRISNAKHWRVSVAWARHARAQMTARGYGSFLLTYASSIAQHSHEWRGFIFLIMEAARYGQPGFFDWIAYLVAWLMPLNLRRGLSVLLKQLVSPMNSR